MFWHLLAAHLLADFPLQPPWLVSAKRGLPGLALHAGVHLLTMVLLVGAVRNAVLAPLITLAFFHFLIDATKMQFARWRPAWVAGPYILDQIVHLGSILLVAAWITRELGPGAGESSRNLMIYLSGYLTATYVWSISEQVLFHAEPEYLDSLERQFWARMISRSAFLSAGLALGQLWGVSQLAVSGAVPYLRGAHRSRTLLTDLGVSAVVTAVILLAR